MRIEATVTAAPTPADGQDLAAGINLAVISTGRTDPQSPLGSPPHHYSLVLVGDEAVRAATLHVGDRIEFEGDLTAITLTPVDRATPITGILTVDCVIWPGEVIEVASPQRLTDHATPA